MSFDKIISETRGFKIVILNVNILTKRIDELKVFMANKPRYVLAINESKLYLVDRDQFSFQFCYSLLNSVNVQFSNFVIRLYSTLMQFRIPLFPFKFFYFTFPILLCHYKFFYSFSNSIVRFGIMFLQIRDFVYQADGALGTSNKLIKT